MKKTGKVQRHNAAKQSSSETWKISEIDDTDAEVRRNTFARLSSYFD